MVVAENAKVRLELDRGGRGFHPASSPARPIAPSPDRPIAAMRLHLLLLLRNGRAGGKQQHASPAAKLAAMAAAPEGDPAPRSPCPAPSGAVASGAGNMRRRFNAVSAATARAFRTSAAAARASGTLCTFWPAGIFSFLSRIQGERDPGARRHAGTQPVADQIGEPDEGIAVIGRPQEGLRSRSAPGRR